MYGNGAMIIGRIITQALRRPILKVLPVGLTAWAAAAVGSVLLGTAVPRAVTSAVPTTVAASWAFVCQSPNNNIRVFNFFVLSKRKENEHWA